MKTKQLLVGIFLFILITSCNHTESNNVSVSDTTNLNELDTLIQMSQKNFETTNQLNKQSDSIVSTKVEHTVKKITKMEGEIKQLKQENNELKDKLDDATDAGNSYRIRAISDSKNN